jgi:formate C-acetyltransferase
MGGTFMMDYQKFFNLSAAPQIPKSAQGRRDAYFRAMPEICIERAALVTKYHVDHELLGKKKISVRDKARAYHYVQENRTAVVWHTSAMEKTATGPAPFALAKDLVDESPLAGSTTSKFKGIPLFPEFMALSIWPELYTISTRAANPHYLDTAPKSDGQPSDAERLDREIFAPWMNDTVLELARAQHDPYIHQPNLSLFEHMQYAVFYATTKIECISHTIPTFQRAVRRGVAAMIADAEAAAAAATDPEKSEFFQAVAIALDGILVYAERLAAKAEAMAQVETDAGRREKLSEIAARYRRVPRQPAESFRDGVTTVWLCWSSILQENQNVGISLGRLDQLLHPLLQKELANAASAADQKRVLDDAFELLCHFWLKIGDHVPMMPEAGEQLYGGAGSNQAITIGGVNYADGKPVDAVNDLTYLMLDATEAMKLRDPNLNARYHTDVNDEVYLRRVILSNINTRATPAVHNDKAVIKMLQDKGATPAHAMDYGIVGCVEPVSAGRHYGHTGSVLINLPAVLEWTFYNGRHRHTGLGADDPVIGAPTGDPRKFADFEQFMTAFEKQIDKMVDDVVTLNNWLGETHQHYYPTPTLSALFEGPMDKGMDVIMGGATYNSSGMAIIGLADAADSLASIAEVVFANGRNRFGELLAALDPASNGAGHDALFAELARPERRYGRQGSAGTALAARIAAKLDAEFGKRKNYRGGDYRVGYYSVTSHAAYGLLTGALPSGRKNKAPLASGITPESNTPVALTETLASVGSLPATALGNGFALNISFAPFADTPATEQRCMDYVKGYFAAPGTPSAAPQPGGLEVQFNMMGREALRQALAHPDPHLLVRVSGYTAYFKDLSATMQQEVITRTEYGYAAGQVIPIAASKGGAPRGPALPFGQKQGGNTP